VAPAARDERGAGGLAMIPAADPASDGLLAPSQDLNGEARIHFERHRSAPRDDTVAVCPLGEIRASRRGGSTSRFREVPRRNVVLNGENPECSSSSIVRRCMTGSDRRAYHRAPTHLAALGPRFPGNTAPLRPRAPQERAEHHRLIEVVHHECVMRSCAPEVCSPGGEAEVVVRPGSTKTSVPKAAG